MKWIWDIIGYSMAATGLIAWFLTQTPVFAWIAAASAPAGDGIMWYASNLEIVFPVAAFFIISDMNPKRMVLGIIIALIIGGGLWLAGF
jgi:hypothetical protein